MDQEQQKIEELKAKLAALAPSQEPGIETPAAPLQTPVEPKGVFDDLLSAESHARQERQLEAQVAATNQKLKSCPDCFFTQSVNQYACELCGIVPAAWLAALEYPTNQEWNSLRTMAAKATIQELKIALRSGWCATNPERERTANNILAARIRQQDVKEVRDKVSTAVKAYDEQNKKQPELPPKEKVKWLSAVYDKQLAELKGNNGKD
jgi:hypothetical protein